MPQVYNTIMESETKRFDDVIARLDKQIQAYGTAQAGAAAASATPGITPQEAALARQRFADAVGRLQSQINDSLLEIKLIDARVEKLSDAAKSFPPCHPKAESRGVDPCQRFFFAPR
jgi:hypothetical protein